jgi:flagellar biosynthesis chaperone FliJ
MKVPKYPLQAVLDQRKQAKEDAKKVLARAFQALQAEQKRLEDLMAERDRLVAERDDRIVHLYDPDPSGLLDVSLVERRRAEVRYVETRIADQDRAIADQQARVRQAEQAVETAKAQLIEADQALKAIEKHYERWLADWKREMALKEQKLTEEIASARFVRERAEADSDEVTE